MLKDEIAEIFELFDYYKIPENEQRRLFERGLYFDFTYGDPDLDRRNQHLNVFGVGILLKTCQERGIDIDIEDLLDEPEQFKNEDLVSEVAQAQHANRGIVFKLGERK